jgi:hypothetical protein
MRFYNPGRYGTYQTVTPQVEKNIPGQKRFFVVKQAFAAVINNCHPAGVFLETTWHCTINCDGINLFEFASGANYLITEKHVPPGDEEIINLIIITHKQFRNRFNSRRLNEFPVFDEICPLDGSIEKHRLHLSELLTTYVAINSWP